MAITFHKSRDEEHQKAIGLDANVVSNRYFNADKTIEKFINIYNDPDMLVDPAFILNDPTFTGFKLYFHFAATSGLLADEQYPNSALAYLKRIGDDVRYKQLKTFIHTLSKINAEVPWIFQEIDGLSEIYNRMFADVNVLKDSRLSIKCFETIDNKMMALNQLWRNIYWDKSRKVNVLPDNLRQFSMSIYIIDMRVFNSKFKFLRNAAKANEITSLTEVNHMLFDVGMCEFDELSGASYFDSMSNTSVDESTSSLVLKYGDADVSSLFMSITGDETLSQASFDLAANSTMNSAKPKFSFKDTMRGAWEIAKQATEDTINDFIDVDKWKTKLTDYAETEASSRIDAVNRDLERLYLGNLQNFTIDSIINKLNDTLPLTGKFGSPTIQDYPSLAFDTTRLPGPTL